MPEGETAGIRIIAGAVKGARWIVVQRIVPLINNRRFRFLFDMTGFTHEKLGVKIHQRPDPFVFAVGKIRVADETYGTQILRQLRVSISHKVKMPVFFKFLETPGLIKDFRFLLLLMFFQKRPQ